MNIINIFENKTLKLQNLLSVKIDLNSEDLRIFDTAEVVNPLLQSYC